jgi:hypothetical protein
MKQRQGIKSKKRLSIKSKLKNDINTYRDIPYAEVERYADREGLNISDSNEKYREAAILLFNEKYNTKMVKKEEGGEILIYQDPDKSSQIEVKMEGDTVWLTIDQMVLLFQKSRATINEHILNIFEEKELDSKQVMRKIGISDFSFFS